jgi:hypothetical protein
MDPKKREGSKLLGPLRRQSWPTHIDLNPVAENEENPGSATFIARDATVSWTTHAIYPCSAYSVDVSH